MSPEVELLINKFAFHYCLYKATEIMEYNDFRRSDKYNHVYEMIEALGDILYDEDDNESPYKQELLDIYNETEIDPIKNAIDNISSKLSTLEIGKWYIRTDDNGKCTLFSELEYQCKWDYDIKDVLTDDFILKIGKLKNEAEKELYNYEEEHRGQQYGFAN